jgi:hypothetical protein
MTTTEINKKLAELLGVEPKTIHFGTVFPHYLNVWPDFCTDPRLVLDELDRKGNLDQFVDSLWTMASRPYAIPVLYIRNTTGLLAAKACEWLEHNQK